MTYQPVPVSGRFCSTACVACQSGHGVLVLLTRGFENRILAYRLHVWETRYRREPYRP